MNEDLKAKGSKFTSVLILLMPFLIILAYLLTVYRLMLADPIYDGLLYISNMYSFLLGIIMYKVLTTIKEVQSLSVKALIGEGNMMTKIAFGFFILSTIIMVTIPILNSVIYMGFIQ